MARAKLNKRAKTAALLAWYTAGQPTIDGPVVVSIVIRRSRRIDPINALSGYKAIEDGLFCRKREGYGITPDDSERYVSYGELRQEAGKEWKGREEVEISVVPRKVANG